MGDQVIALLTLPVFIAISGGLTLALRAVAPNAALRSGWQPTGR